MSRAPCKGCLRRELGCHSSCEDYAEYLQDYKARKAYTYPRAGDIYTAEYIRKHRKPKK